MRLTNYQRDGIIRAVLADLPSLVDHSEAIQKRVRVLNLNILPEKVRAVAKSAELVGYLAAGSIYLNDLRAGHFTTIGILDYDDRRAFERVCYNDEEVKRLANEQATARAAREKAEAELRRDIYLCSTDVVFRERFPGLSSYLPEKPADVEKVGLPSTTVTMDALKAAGWPVEKDAA